MKRAYRALALATRLSMNASGNVHRSPWVSDLNKSTCLAAATGLLLAVGTHSLSAFTLLSSNQLVFINLDHAPMGACSTITYGYKGATCGVGTSTGVYPYYSGVGGVLMGLSGNSGLQILPFVGSAASISSNAHFFADASIQRAISPCTDQHIVAGSGLSFTCYTPAWSMPDFSGASLSEKRRYLLPATWLVFTIQNTNRTPEDFYFGLPATAAQKAFANNAYQGFVLGEAALAVQSGTCELLSGARLTSLFNGMTNGFAFHVSVPAGQTRTQMVVLAYYRSTVVDGRTGSYYYYTSLYPSIDSVIDSAFAGFGDAQARCQQLATAMNRAGLNPYRQFMASHALHSYMANTACLIDPQGRSHWWEIEGFFNYINTFDLTVDHAFFDSLVQPWALRNVLDGFSGALTGAGYSYDSPLYNANTYAQVSNHGFSFYHDMGLWPNSGTGPAYTANMGLEELQSWILSAGLYWSQTGDNAWLTNNSTLLQTCLNSLLTRDSTNSAARDGVPENVNSGEITTYDNLDASLQRSGYSGRMTVRNWASYLALNAMFTQIGDVVDASTCQSMAGIAAQTIVDRWNSYHASLGYIPALLDGSSAAAITPMVEGLAYPAAMGLTNAVDRNGGPYASMLQALSNHMVAILVPGKCLGSPSGGWMMTSANIITWQSKIFICQYAAETVLGIPNNLVDGAVDQAHVSIQFQLGPNQGWVDATDGTGNANFAGGPHYPRAITTALWWLNATNNPSNPVATSIPDAPTSFTATATDRQVLLLWQGVPFALGYNLKRASVHGGPYTPVSSGSGASFVDTNVANGTTYYYVLTATNQFGESAPSAEVSATPVPGVGANISASISGSQIKISWPPSYVGWILQTNTAGLGNSAAWGDVPGSLTDSQMTLPVSGPTEYFRLRHP